MINKAKNLKAYFDTQKAEYDKSITTAANTAIKNANQAIATSKIGVRRVIKSKPPKEKQVNITEIENQHRLEVAQKKKKELEDKLAYLNETIDNLSGKQPETAPSKSFSFYKEKEDFYKNENPENALARKNFIKYMDKHKQQRDEKRKIQKDKMNKEIQDSLKREEDERFSKQEEAKEERKLRIALSQQKLESRRQEREEFKKITLNQFKKAKSNYPLYKEIEDKYIQNRVLPELQQKKQEIARKREMLQPYTKSEIEKHSKRYKSALSEQEIRRKREYKQWQLNSKVQQAAEPSYYKSQAAILEEQERLAQSFEATEAEVRRRAKDKRQKYSELVKELYRPRIDPDKKIEAVNMSQGLTNSRSVERKLRRSEVSDVSPFIPRRKYKPNLMIPEPKPVKAPEHVVDYLSAQRKRRSLQAQSDNYREKRLKKDTDIFPDEQLPDEEKIKHVQNKTIQIEKQAKLAEHMYSNISPTNPNMTSAAAAISDMYIDSIKAKLAILKNT